VIVDNGKYYIYLHLKADSGQPFYVGVGTKRKRGNKYARAFQDKGRNHIWESVYKKHGLKVDIVCESDNIKFISLTEEEFIKYYGRVIKGDGCLTNMDLGGYIDRGMKKNKSEIFIKKATQQCYKMAANNVGKNHFYSLARNGYAYNIDGSFAFSFRSGIEAERVIGNGAKSYNINKRIDKPTSYLNYFFSSVKVDFLDTTGFRVNPVGVNFSKKEVVKIDHNGNQLCVYPSIKEAAKSNNITQHALAANLRLGRKTRCGIFKYKEN